MTINNIKLSMMASSYGAYNQKLTPETRAKLDEYNIPYIPSITEQQGQALIKAYEANKFSFRQNQGQKQTQSNDPLLQKALELAQKVGINVDEGDTFDKIISKIEKALEIKIEQNKNNESELKELKSLSMALANLQAQNAQSMGFDATNKALEKSLEFLGEYNKNYFMH
ncbi:hypothetical protein IJ670_00460 [bacterium]|nr:hypothetical protein [bacterium]